MFEMSPKASALKTQLKAFMESQIYPNEGHLLQELEEGGAWSVQPVAVPNMACEVVDWAIQTFGGGGSSNDFRLGRGYATARSPAWNCAGMHRRYPRRRP